MMTRVLLLALLAFPLAFLLQPDARAKDKQGTVVELGGMKSTAPADWKQRRAASQTRAYQFVIPGTDGADAELVVFFFNGQGGSAAANVTRWKGMFVPPEGKTIDDVSKLEKVKVGEDEATYLDVQGTYRFKARPFDPNAKEELKPDYEMLAVVLPTKSGPYFIRMVGPAKTVAQHKKDFEDWFKAFK